MTNVEAFFSGVVLVSGFAATLAWSAMHWRLVVKLRKMEAHDRAEMEAILDTYKGALGL